MQEYLQSIDDVYKLHLISKNINHGIGTGYHGINQWRLFEPSRFVYAFFAYNTIYSINWRKTVEKNEIINWDANNPNDTINREVRMSETKKMRELSKFIYETHIFSEENKDLSDNKKKFAEHYKKTLFDNITLVKIKEECIASTLRYITTDKRITTEDKERFRKNLLNLIEGNLINKDFTRAVDSLMVFIYNVRNNIFHGSKTILEMSNDGQRERLLLYAAIIMTMNDLLFEALEKATNWHSEVVDDQINSLIFQINRRNNRGLLTGKNRRLSSESLKDTKVPKGIFFYPCAGNDIEDPIRQFHSVVKEFHFVDIDHRFLRQFDRIPRSRSDSTSFPGSRIMVEECPAKTLLVSGETCLPEDVLPASKPFEEEKISHQHWISRVAKEAFDVYYHQQDGLTVLSRFRSIAIFYLLGDSDGEGGSRQRWFQQPTFSYLLEKLEDGGLIVTDGASRDRSDNTSVWKEFWGGTTRYINDRREVTSIPDDFEYKNLQFRCLGQAGWRYGPVFVWQVHKNTRCSSN